MTVPVPALSSATVETLRALFADIGYHEASLLELTGLNTLAKVPAPEGPRVLSVLDGAGRLGVVAKLLWLGVTLDEDVVRDAVTAATLQQWLAAGLVIQRKGRVGTEALVLPWAGRLFVTDSLRMETKNEPDFVMAVGGGTRVLESMMVSRPVERALDLGCGCGILALHASDFARQVDGVDRNPRAIAYAERNAALNDTPQCHFHEGDFFSLDEVLGDRRYGLVVSQPPFVISPSRDLLYRDAQGEGDEELWRIAHIAASRLEDGGIAQLLTSWLVPKGGDPGTRPHEKLAALDCDAFVATSRVDDLETHAAHWLEELDPTLSVSERSEHLDACLRYLEALEVEAVCVGLIVLRKRVGQTPWRHVTELPETLSEGAGEQLQHIFAGLDFLHREGHQGLLQARLRAPADLRVEQCLAPTDQGWETEWCMSRKTSGMRYEVSHDASTADFVLACDGERNVEEIVHTLAQRYARTPDTIKPHVLDVAHTFLSHGLLVVQEP